MRQYVQPLLRHHRQSQNTVYYHAGLTVLAAGPTVQSTALNALESPISGPLGKVVTEFGQEIVDAYYERLTEHRARPSPRPMLETSPKQSPRKIVSRACDLRVNRKSKCDNGRPNRPSHLAL